MNRDIAGFLFAVAVMAFFALIVKTCTHSSCDTLSNLPGSCRSLDHWEPH